MQRVSSQDAIQGSEGKGGGFRPGGKLTSSRVPLVRSAAPSLVLASFVASLQAVSDCPATLQIPLQNSERDERLCRFQVVLLSSWGL